MDSSLESHYAALERRFPLTIGNDYERLVVPQGNAEEPVHRWFHMKEAYSPNLLARLLKDLDMTDNRYIRLHDPFAGSATTLVSAILTSEDHTFQASGVEVNPFLHLLSSAKTRAISSSPLNRRKIANTLTVTAHRIIDQAIRSKKIGLNPPALSAFQNRQYFPTEQLRQLLRLRAELGKQPTGLPKDLLAIALAGCIEPSSRLRRDGRALRYEPEKRLADPVSLFSQRADMIVEDLASISPNGSAVVSKGSSTNFRSWPSQDSVDIVCFSPPYPNNIDYTEIYKLESWFLNLIDNADGFRLQRDLTMQSHPSIRFTQRRYLKSHPELSAYVTALAAPLIQAIPNDRYAQQRERVIDGYLRDAMAVFLNAFRSLKQRGVAVYVVGNSRHGTKTGQYTIASDVLLAAIAERVGFHVQEVKVARALHRRGRDDHLRESVVIIRKN